MLLLAVDLKASVQRSWLCERWAQFVFIFFLQIKISRFECRIFTPFPSHTRTHLLTLSLVPDTHTHSWTHTHTHTLSFLFPFFQARSFELVSVRRSSEYFTSNAFVWYFSAAATDETRWNFPTWARTRTLSPMSSWCTYPVLSEVIVS